MKLNTARQAQCVKTVRLLRVFDYVFGKGFVSIRAVPSVSTTLRNTDGVLSHDRAILAACKTYRCAFLDTLSQMHTPPPPLTRDVRPVHIYIHTVGESECITTCTRFCVLTYLAWRLRPWIVRIGGIGNAMEMMLHNTPCSDSCDRTIFYSNRVCLNKHEKTNQQIQPLIFWKLVAGHLTFG